MGKFVDLSGMVFGDLTVLKRDKDYISPSGYIAVNWFCRCSCGNYVVVRGCNLKNGFTTSCGCKKVKQPSRLKHGGKGTRLYKIWKSMRTRCYNQNDPSYAGYGAKGISICKDWEDFGNFKQWAEAHGYQDCLSIDRIDYTGNYCPENCRWATDLQQANNKSNNHILTFNDETHTMAEWSRITGISYHKIKDRINKCGWSVEKALTVQ